jgi:molybdopterin molybdotransferase
VGAFERAVGRADVIITTGGTAEGPRDHVRAAVEQLGGRLVVDHVAVRPGHPMLLAVIPDSAGRQVPLVGLPGNPHSAVVGFVTLAVPILDALLGRAPRALASVPAAEELRAPAGHTRLVAGNLQDGAFVLSPYGGSAMLRGLSQSAGFAVVPEGRTAAGDHVAWLPLP